MQKIILFIIINFILSSCIIKPISKENIAISQSGSINSMNVASGTSANSSNSLVEETMLKATNLPYIIPNSIILNGVSYELSNSGVLGNMEKYTYGALLGSGAISISKIIDGKFRKESGGENTPLMSLKDFVRRDTGEVLGLFTMIEQMGISDEKFMKFWTIAKPYMGVTWSENINNDVIEFGYIHPKFTNVNCYFLYGKNYYRAEFQKNFDGDGLTVLGENEIKNILEGVKADMLSLKGNFCNSLMK